MPKKKKSLYERQKDVGYALIERLFSDELVDGEEFREILRETPGAVSVLVLREMLHDDIDSARYEQNENLIGGLVTVIVLAAQGNRNATNQLRAIEKVIHADKFEVPHTKIEEIADRYETSPPLARGWELRKLMVALSWITEPIRLDRPSSINQPIRMKEQPEGFEQGFWELAKRHLTSNATLQSLAIRIYLESLKNEGISGHISVRSLKRDLARVLEWEHTASDEEKQRRAGHRDYKRSWLNWFDFSEGWKARRKAGNSRKSPRRNRTK